MTHTGGGGTTDPGAAETPLIGTGEAAVLMAVDECIRDATPEDGERVEACLAVLDLNAVSPQALAKWMCASPASFFALSRVMNARVIRLTPRSVAPFLLDYQSNCTKHVETGILTGAIAAARAVSESWYREFVEEFLTLDLTPEDGNEALIQVAEELIDAGDPDVRARIEDVGRGIHGGADGQLHRAALISIVNLKDPRDRLHYLESVYTSSAAHGYDLGNLLGEFLTNGMCWPAGDARPALSLLLLVLQDPRFANGAAAQLAGKNGLDVPPQYAVDWQRVIDLSKAVRAEQSW